MPLPELCAHRGYAAAFPENTLSAVAAAIELGARYVEIDVQLSKDGIPFLFHDRSLERMCGVAGKLSELTAAELCDLSAAEAGRFGQRFAGEPIASLAGFVALLRQHPDVHAFVEVKRAAIEVSGAEAVLDCVDSTLAPIGAQCALISFSLPFLALVRRTRTIPVGVVFDRWDERHAPIVGEIAPEYVFCDLEGLPSAGTLRDGARTIVIYEVADPQVAVALAARGVHMVETFQIGPMLTAFRERTHEPA